MDKYYLVSILLIASWAIVKNIVYMIEIYVPGKPEPVVEFKWKHLSPIYANTSPIFVMMAASSALLASFIIFTMPIVALGIFLGGITWRIAYQQRQKNIDENQD